MSSTVTQLAQSLSATLKLHSPDDSGGKVEEAEPYRYSHLLPHFSQDHYPPLTPFDHVDPGHRALSHPNPRSFLDNASVVELTPNLGSDVRGINLAELDNNGRDQLALEVRWSLLYFDASFQCVTLDCSQRFTRFQRPTRLH